MVILLARHRTREVLGRGDLIFSSVIPSSSSALSSPYHSPSLNSRFPAGVLKNHRRRREAAACRIVGYVITRSRIRWPKIGKSLTAANPKRTLWVSFILSLYIYSKSKSVCSSIVNCGYSIIHMYLFFIISLYAHVANRRKRRENKQIPNKSSLNLIFWDWKLSKSSLMATVSSG